MAAAAATCDTRARLSACWDADIDWSLYPKEVKEVKACTAMLMWAPRVRTETTRITGM